MASNTNIASEPGSTVIHPKECAVVPIIATKGHPGEAEPCQLLPTFKAGGEPTDPSRATSLGGKLGIKLRKEIARRVRFTTTRRKSVDEIGSIGNKAPRQGTRSPDCALKTGYGVEVLLACQRRHGVLECGDDRGIGPGSKTRNIASHELLLGGAGNS